MVGQGKLIASGAPDTLSASNDPYVRQFLDAQPDGPIAFTYPETPGFPQWLASPPRRQACALWSTPSRHSGAWPACPTPAWGRPPVSCCPSLRVEYLPV